MGWRCTRCGNAEVEAFTAFPKLPNRAVPAFCVGMRDLSLFKEQGNFFSQENAFVQLNLCSVPLR